VGEIAVCENCRFAVQFDPPPGERPLLSPEPEPAPWWKFWEWDVGGFGGYFKLQMRTLELLRQVAWDRAKDRAETQIRCHRYPESQDRSKTYWCGEYQPESPSQ
jgi:hypothetical protein